MALAPQLSRAAYRRGYLQSLSRQAANEAYNLEANLRWLQDGDVEGEAEKAATIQAMARGAIDSKVIELVNYIVRQPDRGFVLSRIPLDQKRWLLIHEDTFLAALTENSRAVPVSGMEFLSVLAAVVRPVQPNKVANQVQQQIAQEHGALTEEPQTAPTNVAAAPGAQEQPSAPIAQRRSKTTQPSDALLPEPSAITLHPTLQSAIQSQIETKEDDEPQRLLGGYEGYESDDSTIPPIPNPIFRNEYKFRLPAQTTGGVNWEDTISAEKPMRQSGYVPGAEMYPNPNTGFLEDMGEYKARQFQRADSAKTKEDIKEIREAAVLARQAKHIPRKVLDEVLKYTQGRLDQMKEVQKEIERRKAINPYNLFSGEGLNKKRKTYIRGAGINPAPGAKEPSHNWQQFGRYVLSRNDLENGNSVHIRYRNGQPVKNIGPKRVVGGSVGAIVRDIADGKAPQEKHMRQIDDDEREYLSGLIKTCNIAIPNGVKTEKKTPKQKANNEFEILKGQVLAGNDNPEIIKKFKNMLKKMVQSGQLNADDVRAIIDELP